MKRFLSIQTNHLGYIIFFLSLLGCASSKEASVFWRHTDEKVGEKSSQSESNTSKYASYEIDTELIRASLTEAGYDHKHGVFLSFPDPNFGTSIFKVWRLRDPQQKHSSITSYYGYSLSDLSSRIYLDIIQSGMQAVVITKQGNWFISPVDLEKDIYLVYSKASQVPDAILLTKELAAKKLVEVKGTN